MSRDAARAGQWPDDHLHLLPLDDAQRPGALAAHPAGSLLDLSYRYDAVGNVKAITDTANSRQVQSFNYDAIDRLIAASTTLTGTGQYSESYQYNAIGNITNKAGVTYWYSDTLHKHATTHLGGVQKYWYDANGNMTRRDEGSTTYNQTWDVENRLSTVTVNGQTTTFYYDGDGKRVKKVQGGQTTAYLGAHYEKNVTTGVTTTYYYAGSTRVAMRQGSTVYYLHGDHLGSASLTTNVSGNKFSEERYYPYGVTRYGSSPTDRQFTGQRKEDASLGSLYDYGARFYSPGIMLFIQPDAIVPNPGNPKDLNRYAYARSNPLKYTDPTGHSCVYVDGHIKCDEAGAVSGAMTVPYNPDNPYPQGTPDEKGFWTTLGVAGAIAVVSVGGVVLAKPLITAALTCGSTAGCREKVADAVQEAWPSAEQATGQAINAINSSAPKLSEQMKTMLLDKAVAASRVGVSPVGSALQKHSARPGSWLEGMASAGNALQNTKVGTSLLEKVMQDGSVTYSEHPVFGEVIRVRLADGAGAWWKATGEFIGFLEQYTPKQ